jgi:hypothetical protein
MLFGMVNRDQEVVSDRPAGMRRRLAAVDRG